MYNLDTMSFDERGEELYLSKDQKGKLLVMIKAVTKEGEEVPVFLDTMKERSIPDPKKFGIVLNGVKVDVPEDEARQVLYREFFPYIPGFPFSWN